ncbi:MAG: hypothetical protein WA738_14010 [Candidatus Angelobacter sp.]
MANFLNRMAARAVGAAKLAQPFVPAMFSPGFALVRNDAPGHAGMEPEIASIEVAAAPIKKAAVHESTRDATLPEERELLNFTAVSRDAAVSSQADFLPVLQSAAENQDRLPPTTLPAIPPHFQPEAIRPYDPDGSTAASFDPNQKPLPEGEQLIANEAVIVHGAGQSGRPTSPTLRVAPMMLANAGAMYSRREQARSSESEAPVIRVSIGRIDVRAQFSAAATPSPAPPRNTRRTALSLDEYLKQRSEGKR